MAKRALREKINLDADSVIPEKLYFKIGEVAQLVGVQAHVIRYWEKEITSVRPQKSRSNQRRYRRKDVELLREVKRLLHDEKYTLAGAKKKLSSKEAAVAPTEAGLEVVEHVEASANIPEALNSEVVESEGAPSAVLTLGRGLPKHKVEKIRKEAEALLALALNEERSTAQSA